MNLNARLQHMNRVQILKEIDVLTSVVRVNRGFLGNDVVARSANNRIYDLIEELENKGKERNRQKTG